MIQMTRITLVINDELLGKFREAAFKRYGLRKGTLSKFAEDSFKCILKEVAEKITKEA